MHDEALEVLSGVVEGDESSVEGWYLGGWGLWLMAEQEQGGRRQEVETAAEDEASIIAKNESESNRKGSNHFTQDGEKDRISHLRDSRTWLNTCLALATQLDYEDDRLRDHAQELVQEIERLLLDQGVAFEDEGDDDDDEEEGWEGVDSSEEDDDNEDDRENNRNDNEDWKNIEKPPSTKGDRKNEKDATEQTSINDVIMSGI